MGTTYAKVTITSVTDPAKFLTDSFLVDTGAMDSVFPTGKLHQIGVVPRGSRRYELADGSKVSFQFGIAEFKVMGRITSGRIIFSPENAEPLLGATILESAALRVNPVKKKLEKLTAGLMK